MGSENLPGEVSDLYFEFSDQSCLSLVCLFLSLELEGQILNQKLSLLVDAAVWELVL